MPSSPPEEYRDNLSAASPLTIASDPGHRLESIMTASDVFIGDRQSIGGSSTPWAGGLQSLVLAAHVSAHRHLPFAPNNDIPSMEHPSSSSSSSLVGPLDVLKATKESLLPPLPPEPSKPSVSALLEAYRLHAKHEDESSTIAPSSPTARSTPPRQRGRGGGLSLFEGFRPPTEIPPPHDTGGLLASFSSSSSRSSYAYDAGARLSSSLQEAGGGDYGGGRLSRLLDDSYVSIGGSCPLPSNYLVFSYYRYYYGYGSYHDWHNGHHFYCYHYDH